MKIHFIGIGGIGMSALARYFLARGDEVSGSDAIRNEIVAELEGLGVKISIGNNKEKENLDSRFRGNDNTLDLVIYSAAVKEDNAELVQARKMGIKTQKYAQALGDLTRGKFTIAISGMHGKSTTTAMVGLIMEKAGLDPTVIVGTKVGWRPAAEIVRPFGSGPQGDGRTQLRQGRNSTEDNVGSGTAGDSDSTSGNVGSGTSNFRAGESKYLVIEADEYDKSILNYWPKILVLLNLEEEHLDTYKGGLPEILETFGEYISHLPEDGVLIANEEDENVAMLINPKSEFLISKQIPNPKFKIQKYKLNSVENLNLKIPGQHNLSNANAALAVARVLGIDEKIAIEALNDFSGTWRRMEYKGMVNGAKIYDDYGHHPTEIMATLRSAAERPAADIVLPFGSGPQGDGRTQLRQGRNSTEDNIGSGTAGDSDSTSDNVGSGKLWVVFQPHQYHRTYDLFDKFVEAFDAADKIILLPIYSVAGREDEEIKQKVSSEKLAEKIRIRNQESGIKNQEILFMDNFNEVMAYLRKNLQPGDVCVIMGAGDIYRLTERLFKKS